MPPTNYLIYNKKYLSQQRQEEFLDSLHSKRSMQAKSIKEIELSHMKYKLFLTIKTQILKMIKENELDKYIAILRRRKFTRLHIIFTKLLQRVLFVAEWVKVGREAMIRRQNLYLMRFRIGIYLTRAIKYKMRIGINEFLRVKWIKPQLHFLSDIMEQSRYIRRAHRLIRDFLGRTKQQFYFGVKIKRTLHVLFSLRTNIYRYLLRKKEQEMIMQVSL